MTASDSGLTPVEQHLGDRLAALVDGELGHEARERVLAHLATCVTCKAEADAQRRLKSVFADTAPPPPSDGLLARLQGLPTSGDGESGPGQPGEPASSWDFDYLRGSEPSSRRSLLTPPKGFRIHEPEPRSGTRHRRLAFAAAGAVSLAALALGGGMTSGAGGPVAAGQGGDSNTSAVRSSSSGGEERSDRRRAGDRRQRAARVEKASGQSASRQSGTPSAVLGGYSLTPGVYSTSTSPFVEGPGSDSGLRLATSQKRSGQRSGQQSLLGSEESRPSVTPSGKGPLVRAGVPDSADGERAEGLWRIPRR
ncbi:zf-HC2 domain-containing protein [Streptomyces sp. NPDC005438]|uniref:anti-sigma factor family protein n=1 Tax=Streptomyces sp. NPDC005438 TaxID=3156880 RepID=UPI0033BA77BB